MTAAESKGTIT